MRQRRQGNRARPNHDQRRERLHRAAKSRPDPSGLRGHSRLLLPEAAARVLAARIQNCKQRRIRGRRDFELQKGVNFNASLESSTQTA